MYAGAAGDGHARACAALARAAAAWEDRGAGLLLGLGALLAGNNGAGLGAHSSGSARAAGLCAAARALGCPLGGAAEGDPAGVWGASHGGAPSLRDATALVGSGLGSREPWDLRAAAPQGTAPWLAVLDTAVDRRVLVYACRLAMAQESREAAEEAARLALQCDAAEADLRVAWEEEREERQRREEEEEASGVGALGQDDRGEGKGARVRFAGQGSSREGAYEDHERSRRSSGARKGGHEESKVGGAPGDQQQDDEQQDGIEGDSLGEAMRGLEEAAREGSLIMGNTNGGRRAPRGSVSGVELLAVEDAARARALGRPATRARFGSRRRAGTGASSSSISARQEEAAGGSTAGRGRTGSAATIGSVSVAGSGGAGRAGGPEGAGIGRGRRMRDAREREALAAEDARRRAAADDTDSSTEDEEGQAGGESAVGEGVRGGGRVFGAASRRRSEAARRAKAMRAQLRIVRRRALEVDPGAVVVRARRILARTARDAGELLGLPLARWLLDPVGAGARDSMPRLEDGAGPVGGTSGREGKAWAREQEGVLHQQFGDIRQGLGRGRVGARAGGVGLRLRRAGDGSEVHRGSVESFTRGRTTGHVASAGPMSGRGGTTLRRAPMGEMQSIEADDEGEGELAPTGSMEDGGGIDRGKGSGAASGLAAGAGGGHDEDVDWTVPGEGGARGSAVHRSASLHGLLRGQTDVLPAGHREGAVPRDDVTSARHRASVAGLGAGKSSTGGEGEGDNVPFLSGRAAERTASAAAKRDAFAAARAALPEEDTWPDLASMVPQRALRVQELTAKMRALPAARRVHLAGCLGLAAILAGAGTGSNGLGSDW